MNLQQLRSLREIVRQGLNVSAAAEALFASQPGISRQIRLLEEELGVVLFERAGKRLVSLTEAGRSVLTTAERVLEEVANLRRIGAEFSSGEAGGLAIAATHTQARYVLPKVVREFTQVHPQVRLTLHQGSPTQIAEWTLAGEADIAIATEALDQYPRLVALPCFQWTHRVIAPAGHPIADKAPVSIHELARWPLITYDAAFAGRSRINRAFERAGCTPNVVLAALDADVIKTYVGLGMGLGIIAHMAFDPERDAGLVALEAAHLFESNLTKIGVRRGAYLRGYEYDFIRLFAPHLGRDIVDRAMSEGRDSEHANNSSDF